VLRGTVRKISAILNISMDGVIQAPGFRHADPEPRIFRCQQHKNARSAHAHARTHEALVSERDDCWGTGSGQRTPVPGSSFWVQSVQCPFLLMVDFFILYAITEMDIGLIGPKWSSRTKCLVRACNWT
jgi:hypothetical protein